MNKRQAKLIMQLPDGYQWEFFDNGKYVAGYSGTDILLYEIIEDKLIQRKIKMAASGRNHKVEPYSSIFFSTRRR